MVECVIFFSQFADNNPVFGHVFLSFISTSPFRNNGKCILSKSYALEPSKTKWLKMALDLGISCTASANVLIKNVQRTKTM